MIPYVYVIVYSSRKMVCNVFWTGSEYKIMRSFIVLDLDLRLANFKRCLISKDVSFLVCVASVWVVAQ